MPMETRSSSALFKRAEQLKRWQESETNQESDEVPNTKRRRIKFSDGCVFLAACASGEKEEVERLLEMGADINTANVDGLTALHQACIDDNLDMVEFLVEHGCDVNRGDNEGWTPLHATASCGFASIAKYLLENGANVAAVNNDGDLPIDIAESGSMEEILQIEINKLGVDCDAVRTEEERIMMEDAKQWINSKRVQDKIHPKTGATALHVAAAKGYIKVMSLLIQAGVDLNVQDNDGWTALHAAAHWGQREACEILADNLANMDIQNFAGQTCFDIADHDLLKVLEELKKKQTTLQKEKPEIQEILQRRAPPPLKRRTSVTRMSCADKSSVVMKDTIAERAQIEANLRLDDVEEETPEKKPAILDGVVAEAEDQEIARKNELNLVDRIWEPAAVTNNAKEEESTPQSPLSPIPKVEEQENEQENNVAPWRRGARRPGSFSSKGDTPPQSPTSPTNTQFVEANVVLRPKRAPEPELQKVTEESQERIGSESESSSPEVKDEPTALITGQIRRVFLPPARDEESESQRKAHAKRVRETRRSTQGVTLEDLKSAAQQLLRKQQEEDERKESENDKDEKGDLLPERRLSWRLRNDENKKVDQNASQKESNATETATPTVTLSTPGRTRQRPVSAPPESPDGTPSVTISLRSRLKSEGDASDEKSDKDAENKNAQGNTQAAIQRRRRPKRRSTGVVMLDGETIVPEENQNNNGNSNNVEQSITEGKLIEEAGGDRQRNRYVSSSAQDGSSRLGDRSRTSSLTSSTESLGEKELRKLYEEVKEENERLKVKLKKTEGELEDTKRQLERALKNNMKSSMSDTDKRERRALERKLSEMEEEVKSLAKVKAENAKLKDENRALTRVVSNLSK